MNAGRQEGQSGQGGSNPGSGESDQNSNIGNQGTIITSTQQNGQTTAAGFVSTTAFPQTYTTAPTHSPTSTSTSISSSESSSGNQRAAMIGGITGSIAGLLLIALFVIWLLNRREKRKNIEKRGSAELVTYANLNNSFAGTPFDQSNGSNQQNSLLAPPPFTPSTNLSTPEGVEIRGGDGLDYHSGRRDSEDYFLPTYAQSQAGMSIGGASSLGRLNASPRRPATVSTTSVRYSGSTPVISPQSTGSGATFISPQNTWDTMGFPVDASDIGLNRSLTPTMSIVAPVPRHPLVHRESLERVVLTDRNHDVEL